MGIPLVRKSIGDRVSGYMVHSHNTSATCVTEPVTCGTDSYPNWRYARGGMDMWDSVAEPAPVICSNWRRCIIRFEGVSFVLKGCSRWEYQL